VLAIVTGIATIPCLDPATLRAGIVVALATGFYFFIFRRAVRSRVLPRILPGKEIAIAVCFTAGTAISAAPDAPGDLPAVHLAGLACFILGNCLLISRSEVAYDQLEDPVAFFAIPARTRLLPEIALFAGLAFGVCGWWQSGLTLASLALMLCAVFTLFLAGTLRPGLVRLTQPLADGLHLLTWLVAFLF
jgi:hypothetical protein